ncbi:hypothetical protein NEOLEDRAFT_1181613 [Neolentinus lepideus HHB14362 ss-1]|uniref:Uncharacterized protein n=1 Tax=Neolentinus lepideus HHB14362 ss-1 TaxID=1314782 RepID=A0A165PX57_9AGAM|nr:hypothetical protein NEOLEDRAFT_1181613 [Neolentinus lepideus HHB14362 ss-1]
MLKADGLLQVLPSRREIIGVRDRKLVSRAALGIVYVDYDGSGAQTVFRRSVNPTDSNVKKISDSLAALEAAETKDNLSGVHDYASNEADKYLAYPELMKTLAEYVRKELVHLGRLSDG